MTKPVYLKDHSIHIKRMINPACVTSFIFCIKQCINEHFHKVSIIVDADTVFPNACLPISGIILFCKNHYNMDFEIVLKNVKSQKYLSKCGFTEPYNLTPELIEMERNPFDKIFYYNDSLQVAKLTQSYINAISRTTECAKGVIDGLIWCLNEVMDNVLEHSNCNEGYILVQYHQTTNHVAICIYDYGIGIYKTLQATKHSPKTTIDAISLSLQEGVSDGKGKGNGLYGLYSIVENNEGRLTVTSGDASLFFESGNPIKKYQNLPIVNSNHAGTIVDFQLNLNYNIDITTLFKSIGGFDGFDIRLEDMLTDNDYYKYDVFENCSGTATRESGRESYNDVLNIIARRESPMILDFSNVHHVSSSFIDEFIAKLVVHTGFCKFNQMFKIVGMNHTVEHLCNRAVAMRIYDEWNK